MLNSMSKWGGEAKHLLSLPGIGAVFTSMLNAALFVLRFLKKKNEPMTVARIREKPQKYPKTTRISK